MESLWYYVRDGAQTGPVSFDELKVVAASGQIAAGDLVWQEGTPDWVPARSVAGLFPGPSPPPQPPQPPRQPPPPPSGTGLGGSREALPLADYDRGPPSQASEILALANEFLRRASAPNPAAIKPTPNEEERLTNAG